LKNSDIVLRAVDLYKSYGTVKAIDGVSLEVTRGETKVIVGPNGAGKSTLLKCLNLLIKPDKGRIWLEDVEITNSKTDICKIRQKIGFVFQEFNLFNHLIVLDNVMIGLTKVKKLSKEEAFKRAQEVLELVGVERSLWKRYPAQISGGQKQRVAIARALAMDPIIMLYDEPTSALDPQFVGEILEIIKMLSRNGLTSLIVTHEMGFAREVADEILFMYRGRILEKGPPTQILARPKYEATKRFFKEINRLYGAGG